MSAEWLVLDLGRDINLRTRHPYVGRARCDAFVAAVGDGGWTRMRLSVTEPCTERLLAAIEAPRSVEPATGLAIRGNLPPGRYQELMAGGGHVHDGAVAGIVGRFGEPGLCDWLAERQDVRRFSEGDRVGVTWGWEAADEDLEQLWRAFRGLDRELLPGLGVPRAEVGGELRVTLVDREHGPLPGGVVTLRPRLSRAGCSTGIELRFPVDDPEHPAFGRFWDSLRGTLGAVKPDGVHKAYRFGDGPDEIGTMPTFYGGTGNEPPRFAKPRDPLSP